MFIFHQIKLDEFRDDYLMAGFDESRRLVAPFHPLSPYVESRAMDYAVSYLIGA